MTSDLRETFLSCLKNNLVYETRTAAHAYLMTGSDGGRWRFVRRCVEALPEGGLGLAPVRVALLASFSIEFIHDALIALGLASGLRIFIYQSGFAQYHQELVDARSRLYAFQPDVVLLAIEGVRVMRSVYEEDGSPGEIDKGSVVADAMAWIRPLIEGLRLHSDAMLLMHNFDPPHHRALGILDGMLSCGQGEVVGAANAALLELARCHRGVFVVDYAGLVARAGADHWYDLRMAHVAKAPIAQKMLPRLAMEYLKYLRAAVGLTRKCLVVDLDNTLWGGVVGEEGVRGIKLGPDYPGSAFVAFQRALLRLHDRGVLLAIASKNNPEDVEEVFRNHSGMVLRKEHFACQEIHWQPKSQSLQAIARRLNIGLEHMVFVDDNPVECAQVQNELPMVTVLLFPSRPEEAVALLHDAGWFDALSFSSEDRKRSMLYKQKAQVEELQAASGSLEEFYASLVMRVAIGRMTPATLPRAAQLTQKTNQFNLTTLRYSEEEVARRMADPAWSLWTVQVSDRFGDNGIVGVMMARSEAGTSMLVVDTFLLSCRVIGRTIETAMLACLCQEARRKGLRGLQGRVIPTPKNAPARALYQNHGFVSSSGSSADLAVQETLWELNLALGEVTVPPWITLTGEEDGRANQTTDGGHPGSAASRH